MSSTHAVSAPTATAAAITSARACQLHAAHKIRCHMSDRDAVCDPGMLILAMPNTLQLASNCSSIHTAMPHMKAPNQTWFLQLTQL
jgi:hypothetical protein